MAQGDGSASRSSCRVGRLLQIDIFELAQTMPGISALSSAELDVQAVPVAGGGAGRDDGAAHFFNPQIQNLQVQDNLIAGLQIGAGCDRNRLSVELEAVGVERTAKKPAQARPMKRHANGAITTNLELSGARHGSDYIVEKKWRLVS